MVERTGPADCVLHGYADAEHEAVLEVEREDPDEGSLRSAGRPEKRVEALAGGGGVDVEVAGCRGRLEPVQSLGGPARVA